MSKRVFIQIECPNGEREMLSDIAAGQSKSMSKWVRDKIHEAHNRRQGQKKRVRK